MIEKKIYVQFIRYCDNYKLASKIYIKDELPELPNPGDEMLLNNELYMVIQKEHLHYDTYAEDCITIKIEKA